LKTSIEAWQMVVRVMHAQGDCLNSTSSASSSANDPLARVACVVYDSFDAPSSSSSPRTTRWKSVLQQIDARRIPLIVLAHQKPTDASLNCAHVHFLRKPLLLSRLRAKLASVVDMEESAGLSPSPPQTQQQTHSTHLQPLNLSSSSSSSSPSTKPLAVTHALSDMRILIVDDNATNRKIALHTLKSIGYTNVETATNGQEAVHQVVSAVQHQPFDLLLMDVHMPVKSGIEATREIVNHFALLRRPTLPSPPSSPTIIAMTASSLETERRECLDAGMQDFLIKPIAKLAFADMLQLWLEKRL
jgi:CheY-like chemotaxis protein